MARSRRCGPSNVRAPLYPSFNQDEAKNPPAKVVELKRRVREANALFVTPACNYSLPGVLKNAIDWAVIATVGKALGVKIAPILRHL